METLLQLVRFAFIPASALAVVAGLLVGLFAIGALFDALDHLDELESRVQALFRQPVSAPTAPPKDSYYRTYWSAR